MAVRIFISYRRSDSQDIAARLGDRLAVAPGIRSVFLDVADIVAGESFPQRLEAALAEADICLVLIGVGWVGVSEDGGTRIGRPDDFVAMEVARALSLGKRVVPVLINGAAMPDAALLPEPVRPVAVRNALFLRHQSFNQDVQILRDALLGRAAAGPIRRLADRWPVLGRVGKGALGLVIGITLMLLIGLTNNALTGGRALETSLGSRALLVLLAAAVIGGAIAATFRWSGRR